MRSALKLSGKRTITRQDSGKVLIIKTPKVQFPKDRKFLFGRKTELNNFL